MMPVNPDPPPQERFFLSPSYRSRAGASPSSAASVVPPLTANSLVVSEDPNKKIRKAYTISKSRESWTEQEHDKFLEALQLFDRDWKKIEAFVGSKTVIQIRSHAQKYFLKAQKNGTTEHVPPPRPKRKAAHPYPQKASKSSSVVPQAMESFQSSPPLLEPKYVQPDSSPVSGNSIVSLSSHTHNRVTNFMKDNDLLIQPAAAPSYSFTASQNPRTWPSGNANYLGNSHSQHFRVPPDFAQVYSFIGSIFDPDASEQLQKLKKMDPINVETVLVLMKNLTINLSSPEFEDHRRLLSSYDFDLETA